MHRPARGRMDTGVSLRTALQSTATGRRGTKVLASMASQRIAAIQTGQAKIPIRAAVITSPGRALAVRALAQVIGKGRASQVGSIARQQLAKVPGTAKLAAVLGGAVGVERGIEAVTGRSPARMVFDLTQRGRDVPDTRLGGRPSKPVTRRTPMAGRLAVGQELPPSHQVVRVWQTFPGGPVFARLADGHIAVQKKDGTIKHFRPYRPVVIPRKWNARSMSRVATALKRQRKTATKIMKITGGMPKGK